jgi:hypothetical protein
MANLGQLNAVQDQQGRSAAAQRGTFGGSGEFLGRAEIARQQALSNAQTLAQLHQSNYQQAVGQYNQQQQQAIQTAQNSAYGLGQLGQNAQQAALQGIQALLGTGAQQQQLQQQQLTGAYQQWLQERMWPYAQTAFYSGIVNGIAPGLGGTTNTQSFGMNQNQQQQAQGGGGGAGMAMSALSLLPSLFGMSDEDDKTDIQKQANSSTPTDIRETQRATKKSSGRWRRTLRRMSRSAFEKSADTKLLKVSAISRHHNANIMRLAAQEQARAQRRRASVLLRR